MKVIYYSKPFFADCDFPLIKALQDKGIDVHYYILLPQNFIRSSILEFNKPISSKGFIKASKMKDMEIYKDCIDLNRLFFIIGSPFKRSRISSWLLWIYTLWHIKRQNADIIHIDWQFENNFEKYLFKFSLGRKKVMTIHDPIMHSGQPNAISEEKNRLFSFSWAEHFVLLNTVQAEEFMLKYSVPDRNISYSILPLYNSISYINPSPSTIEGDYVLFFGMIIPYKGLEYLLDAMLKVHKVHPNLKLVIAGGGQLYFDVSKYEGHDYIIWIHRYVGISELAGLLKKTKFVVCSYKDATQSGVIHTSFAMGVPVIASNVGALAVDVKHGENGILVPPCNVDALADAIISLYYDKSFLQSLRQNIISTNINDDRNLHIANDYINIYNSILNN